MRRGGLMLCDEGVGGFGVEGEGGDLMVKKAVFVGLDWRLMSS